jgi:hypothetical protein
LTQFRVKLEFPEFDVGCGCGELGTGESEFSSKILAFYANIIATRHTITTTPSTTNFAMPIKSTTSHFSTSPINL